MGVYRLSWNHIALHYTSISYHMYHGTYGIFHTYHGFYEICLKWPTNVPSCPVCYYSIIILNNVNPYRRGGGGGWSRVGGKPMLTNCLIFLTLPVLSIDCECWYLLSPLIYLSLSMTERVGPFCNISWKKLTDDGKIRVELIFIYQNNHNDNQPWYWKVYICVSHVQKLGKNYAGSEQWSSVLCLHRKLI